MRTLVWLALLLLTVTILTWSVNAVSVRVPAAVRLFNLLIPGTLPVLLLAAWSSPVHQRTVRALFRALAFVAAVNAIVSLAIFISVNLTDLLPAELFLLNPRYPVILTEMRGESWVRTPGIFEAGGSNGSFLLLCLALLLSYLLFAPPEEKRRLLWGAVALHIVLIALTLTRRSLVGLGFQLLLFGVAGLFLKRRYGILIGAALLVPPLTVGVYLLLPDLFQLRTFLQRVELWEAALGVLGAAGPARSLLGFGVLQASMELAPGFDLTIFDNAFLAMLVYGGAIYVASWFLLLVVLTRMHGRLLRSAAAQHRWMVVASLVLLATAVALGSVSVFVTNITESLPYIVVIGVLTKYLAGSGESVMAGQRGRESVERLSCESP